MTFHSPWAQPSYKKTKRKTKKKAKRKAKKATKKAPARKKKAKKKAPARKKAKKAAPKAKPARKAPARKKHRKKKAVGKAPTHRRTRAVSLTEVRRMFTWEELDHMGRRARAALAEVRAGTSPKEPNDWYEIGVTGVSYRIMADEDNLLDFLWRIGEQAQANPPALLWRFGANPRVAYYCPPRRRA